MTFDAEAAPGGMTPDQSRLTRHYLVVHGLRWLPTGLLIPIMVLLFTSRGFSLTEFGVLGTVMGATTFLLEVPTGGLADTLGRRKVLLTAAAFVVLSEGLLVVVALSPDRPSFALVLAAMVAMGVYRALESGPLDAWYVDGMHDLDGHEQVEVGLGRAGTVTGFGIATGSLGSGGIMAWDPVAGVEPMAVVLAVSIALVVAHTASIVVLMDDPRTTRGRAALVASLREVPAVLATTARLVRTSGVLALLLVVEATWSVGMVAFENLFPVRLETLAGSTETAAALLGPVGAAAWCASGLAAGLVTRLSRRIGAYRAAMLLRVVQATTITVMGLLAGVAGVVAAYIGTYAAHGASAPVHYGLLHRQVGADQRTTVLSLNSMAAFAAFSVAGIAIGALADTATVPAAMLACAAVTGLGALAYALAAQRDPTAGRPPTAAEAA